MGRGISADAIILGFTGSIGSGCTYIAEAVAKYYSYKYFSLSDLLRKEAQAKGLGTSCAELQDFGNELRRKHGNSYLIKLLEKELKKDPNEYQKIIIDSIRNDGEVKTLKQFPYFYLFSVHADEHLRLKRTKKIKKFSSNDEFKKADSRDQAEDAQHGQQVKKCNYLADIILNNNAEISASAVRQKKNFIDEVYEKFISVIEDRKTGRLLPDRLPSANETLMTMAYAESQRSSCLKRKVGALIAFIDKNDRLNERENAIRKKVHVLSTGHNEVPLGTVPCIFNQEYERCFRDRLQEDQAKKIKHCPECGEQICLPRTKCQKAGCNFETENFVKFCPKCQSEIEIRYICSKCKTDIFKTYLVGSGGKLLDMCRALHAEENALLNLAKISSQSSDNLVLFTTTYPCNLCANKIVAAGIKKVIYADPYPMKEAKETLEAGGVETIKFEGIKSSAYFRLYNS